MPCIFCFVLPKKMQSKKNDNIYYCFQEQMDAKLKQTQKKLQWNKCRAKK
jgi:hypothetical protein